MVVLGMLGTKGYKMGDVLKFFGSGYVCLSHKVPIWVMLEFFSVVFCVMRTPNHNLEDRWSVIGQGVIHGNVLIFYLQKKYKILCNKQEK